MLKNKKILIAVLVAVVAIVATIFTFFQKNLGGTSGGSVAYVDTISNIMGSTGGGNDRYSGVVEAQQSVKVNKNQEKKIEQVFVSVGDQVIPTTVLFRYDVSEAQKQISSINLDIESLRGTITDKYNAISEYKASGDTSQIAIAENDIRVAQLSIQQKQRNKKKSIMRMCLPIQLGLLRQLMKMVQMHKVMQQRLSKSHSLVTLE